MIVKVHMLAFRDDDIREVDVPDEDTVEGTERLLEATYKYGQNEFQPLPLPSVSVGDVVELNEQFFAVLGMGFGQLSPDEFERYRRKPRPQRTLDALMPTPVGWFSV